jgi:hypothetical protein
MCIGGQIMTEDLMEVTTIATAMFEAGLDTATALTASKYADPETLRQATILVLGTVLEATPEIETRRDMREASDQAGRETWFQLTALRGRADAGERRVSLDVGSGTAECREASDAGMDPDTYRRCLRHLAAAEACMSRSTDGWNLARLSHVIESLKEEYDPRSRSTAPAHMTAQ